MSFSLTMQFDIMSNHKPSSYKTSNHSQSHVKLCEVKSQLHKTKTDMSS